MKRKKNPHVVKEILTRVFDNTLNKRISRNVYMEIIKNTWFKTNEGIIELKRSVWIR